MTGTARIIVTGIWTWDGDGGSSKPDDIEAYNTAMEAIADAVREAGSYADDVTLVSVEATG